MRERVSVRDGEYKITIINYRDNIIFPGSPPLISSQTLDNFVKLQVLDFFLSYNRSRERIPNVAQDG